MAPVSHKVSAKKSCPLRKRILDMRSSLLSLHKALILAEQVTYERINGRVESTGQLLQLVLNDPWFTWLHPVSQLVVRIDDLLEEEGELSPGNVLNLSCSCSHSSLLQKQFPAISATRVSPPPPSQDAQKGRPARPQRVKPGGVPSGAHGATNKEHHVCARRRVSEAAGSPLRIMTNRERSWGPFSASCYGFHPDN